MSRHRDFRNIDLDDYADDDYYDEDENYEEYDYSAPTKQSKAAAAANLAAAHHRAQLNKKTTQQSPQQIEQSSAFFKTKPAKKGKGTATTTAAATATAAATTSSTAPSTSSSASRPPPGFAPISSSTSTSDGLDADTRAAIEASLAEQAFLKEAGLTTSATSASASSSSSALSQSHSQSIRSADAARETERALEQLRLEKMRQRSSEHPTIEKSPVSSPTRTGGIAPSQSMNSLTLASASGLDNMPLTPLAASSSSSSSSTAGEFSDAPQFVSAKRAKEVSAAEAEAATAMAADGSDHKAHLNMVVIGHVDAGKSTLMGHLLFLQGRVSKKLMHKYEKESKELGKSSFHFAWVLDETDEERTRGITVDVAVNYIESPTKKITLLDAPGHKEFIPNMITGAAQADAAILVVPATKGEFEGGFSEDGQIREHATLARSLGISQLILAVNKLDTCDWDEKRYKEIVGQMIPYLKSVGFKEKDIWSIPVSGLTGENIMECREAQLKEWYNGPVLLDLIDRFEPPQRHTDKPMRMCIQDVFKGLTLGQTICGKLETGTILLKDKVLLLPIGETLQVKAMESRGSNLTVARAGDNVEIGVKDFTDSQILQVGQWICDPQYPIPMVTHFRAQIITMNYKIPLLQGSQLTFFTQAATEPIVLHSVLSLIDKVTGAVIKTKPRVLPRQSTAIVELTSRNKICLELFRSYRELGRFALRRGNETVAVGITTKLFRS